ncbi:patatin-like phospholipase family protein [bacterium]|nr:patatin-like phospholipase family protein [bacterium]
MFKKRTFIVLSGGGARGIAHLAILEKIKKKRISAFLGTSAGALAASLYSLYNGDQQKIIETIEKIDQLDEFKDMEHYFNELKGRGILALPKKVTTEIKLLKGSALFPQDNFQELLYEIFGNTKIEDLPIPIFITAVNLRSGNYTVFSKGELVPRLLASMAIPTIFSPVYIGDTYFIDGGVLDNLPVALGYKLGATHIIASDISSSYRGLIKDIKGLTLIFKTQDIFEKNIVEMEKQLATKLLDFNLDKFKWYNFSKSKEIFEQAKEDVKKGFIINKRINKRFLRRLLDKHSLDIY